MIIRPLTQAVAAAKSFLYFVNQTTVPAFPTSDQIDGRFTGDTSNLLFIGEKRITSATAFGQPTSGYTQRLENAVFHLTAYNEAGHNSSLTGNGGRTGASILDLRFHHAGQGDYGAIHITGVVAGNLAGATSFLAQPAGVMMNGNMFIATEGGYANILELNADDLGFSVAAIGAVFNFYRTGMSNAMGQVWMGIRPQSQEKECDVGYSLAGKWRRGVDMSDAQLDPNQAAITLKAGQRIFFSSIPQGEVAWSQIVGTDYIYSDGTNIVASSSGGFTIAGTGALSMAGGNQFSTGTKKATFTATNKPGSNNSGPTQWMKVKLNGYTFWVPCFPD